MPGGHEDRDVASSEVVVASPAGVRSAGVDVAVATGAAAACLGFVKLKKDRLMGAFGIMDCRPRAVARRQLLQIILFATRWSMLIEDVVWLQVRCCKVELPKISRQARLGMPITHTDPVVEAGIRLVV